MTHILICLWICELCSKGEILCWLLRFVIVCWVNWEQRLWRCRQDWHALLPIRSTFFDWNFFRLSKASIRHITCLNTCLLIKNLIIELFLRSTCSDLIQELSGGVQFKMSAHKWQEFRVQTQISTNVKALLYVELSRRVTPTSTQVKKIFHHLNQLNVHRAHSISDRSFERFREISAHIIN